jgi:hypothetical protein
LVEANKEPEEAPTLVVVMSEAHVTRGGTISIAILWAWVRTLFCASVVGTLTLI